METVGGDRKRFCAAGPSWVEGIRGETGYQRRDWVSEERLGIRGETGYQRRDWVSEERLVGIRCCSVFSGVELPLVKLPMQAPRRSLRQEDRSPATCRLLAPLKTVLTRIPSICLILPHTFRTSHTSRTSRTFRTSCNILVHLTFLYTRPFLVVVLQQRHVKNITINIAGSRSL